MPIKKYDPLFGGDAQKALDSMIRQYGPEKGRSVFYALVNKRRKHKGLSDALKK